MLANGETDYNVIHKKTGASITTIRNALNIGKGSGKIKKTQTIQGYSKKNQTDTGKVEVGEVLSENNTELNPNNLRFEDLSDDVKTRLIHQYTQENQGLNKNNWNKPELTNIGDMDEEINPGTGGIVPKNTDNQEQFTRMMWLQSEPIIRKVEGNLVPPTLGRLPVTDKLLLEAASGDSEGLLQRPSLMPWPLWESRIVVLESSRQHRNPLGGRYFLGRQGMVRT